MGFNEPDEKIFTPMPFCYLPKNKTTTEIEILILRHRLEDLQKRLAVGDFEINDPDLRSPSPESAFDPHTGKQVNTREQRARDKYTREKTPADYIPPVKKKKIPLPDGETGESPMVGLIIGPGGKTHKDLEKRSKCKIFIRGKGANTKSRIYNRKENDEREPLHVSVESQNEEDLAVGVRLINELLDPSSDVKKNQLIEIAAIRGTLRDDWCEDCGEKGHRRFECPNKINSWKKVEIICEICGQKTHPTRDCPMKNAGFDNDVDDEQALDDFLLNFHKKKEERKEQLENGKIEEEVKKDSAFSDAAKKVFSKIEKEEPGILPKDVKQKAKVFSKEDRDDDENKDRVVAIRNEDRHVALNGPKHPAASVDPLKDLSRHYKDSYGKLLEREALDFYDHFVNSNNAHPNGANTAAPRAMPPPPPGSTAPAQPPVPPSHPPAPNGQPAARPPMHAAHPSMHGPPPPPMAGGYGPGPNQMGHPHPYGHPGGAYPPQYGPPPAGGYPLNYQMPYPPYGYPPHPYAHPPPPPHQPPHPPQKQQQEQK
ncbi:unnamed protein product [Moneuplotes crassus]|uniref:CCHC-type domain-containing protein n=1 Tax=Euplotes crassus TaxID=5936 RepID=A0AAD1U9D6_EUPCR|nr:unnamed protein product [Moneuplotes crassus]